MAKIGNQNWKFRKSSGSKGHNKGIKFSEEHKKKISKALKGRSFEDLYGVKEAKRLKENLRIKATGRKHSEETKQKMRGRIPKNYINGLSKLRQGKYISEQWKKIAKEIYERDNYACRICGKKGGKLQAHHIKMWALNPELAYEYSNIITLCLTCHTKIHHNKRDKSGRFI